MDIYKRMQAENCLNKRAEIQGHQIFFKKNNYFRVRYRKIVLH